MAAPLELSRLLTWMKTIDCVARCRVSQQILMSVRAASSSARDLTSRPSSQQEPGNVSGQRAQRISQAMRAYLERAKQFDDYMAAEVAEFEIGKRHLANIMGVDADTFTQQDIDLAISYLLPSGLTDKKAHPMMKHPVEIIPQVKAAQFGMDGRPFHHLFYTCVPNYYQLLHEISMKYEHLKAIEDRQGVGSLLGKKIILAGSQWVGKEVIEVQLKEKLQDRQYAHLTKCLERLASHPYSQQERDFILRFRHELKTQVMLEEVPPLKEDEAGRLYMEAEGKRKSAVAHVKVCDGGSGLVTINDKAMIDFFPSLMCREQIMYPLQLTSQLGSLDVHATVSSGGPSGQAGAIRLAIAKALQSFVKPEVSEQMRLAGLLTKDPRIRERKKPGQEGARRKFTWKKR